MLHLSDRFGHTGPRYFFELLAETERPRVELNVENSRYLLKQDVPLEIPVTLLRSGGYKEELMLTIRDLPEGVELATAISEAEGESSKSIKLKLTTTAAIPFTGPIRIVAIPKEPQPNDIGTAPPLATAKLKLPLLNWQTELIWLTITPPTNTAEN